MNLLMWVIFKIMDPFYGPILDIDVIPARISRGIKMGNELPMYAKLTSKAPASEYATPADIWASPGWPLGPGRSCL